MYDDDKRYESRHYDDEFPRKVEKITNSLGWFCLRHNSQFHSL